MAEQVKVLTAAEVAAIRARHNSTGWPTAVRHTLLEVLDAYEALRARDATKAELIQRLMKQQTALNDKHLESQGADRDLIHRLTEQLAEAQAQLGFAKENWQAQAEHDAERLADAQADVLALAEAAKPVVAWYQHWETLPRLVPLQDALSRPGVQRVLASGDQVPDPLDATAGNRQEEGGELI